MMDGKTEEQTAMTGIVIHNAQDIIDALERHPEFLEQVRNHILTKRLLELPDQVDTLVVSVNRLAETVAILAERVQRVEENQQRFEDRQQRFEERQHGYDSRIRGRDYQDKALRQIGTLVMIDYGMTNTSIIAADGRPSEPEWHRIIQLALNNRNLTRDEINELNETDIILTDENGGLVAAEVSIRADVHDATRARHRADLLAKAAGQAAIAIVICAGHSPDVESTAQAEDVALLHMRE